MMLVKGKWDTMGKRNNSDLDGLQETLEAIFGKGSVRSMDELSGKSHKSFLEPSAPADQALSNSMVTMIGDCARTTGGPEYITAAVIKGLAAHAEAHGKGVSKADHDNIIEYLMTLDVIGRLKFGAVDWNKAMNKSLATSSTDSMSKIKAMFG